MLHNHKHWKQVLAITLVSAVAICSSASVSHVLKAHRYLQRYGYISSDKPTSLSQNSIETNTLNNALKEFQRFNGLPITGKIDQKTLQLMSKPRCGVKDNPQYGSGTRSKRYIVRGGKWFFKDLAYQITKYSKHLERSIVDEQIANAFNLWSEYVDLNFTPKTDGIDFEIRFEEGDHGDGDPFDGSGVPGEDNILAHAAFPFQPNRGDIHFDDAEDWTSSTQQGTNLFWVAVHEIGHSLGLEHTNVPSAVMAPYYQGGNILDLDSDDIEGIQAIYGKKDRNIKTIVKDSYGNVFVLNGNMYINRTENFDANQTPKKISEGWPGLPDNIDAAFSYTNGKIYFFKGSKYWRYDGQKMDGGYPREISEGFPGMPDHVYGTMYMRGGAYFFKGPGYKIYDMSQSPLP